MLIKSSKQKSKCYKKPELIDDLPKNLVVILLAGMLLIAPSIGSTVEELIQDTLKTIIIAGASFLSLTTYFLMQRSGESKSDFHPFIWLPVSLSIYALSSMLWSHTYLASVEFLRWSIFSLIFWLGLNSISIQRFSWISLGIHIGVTIASIWTALQFWFGLDYFPQGAGPASTFVNRNFFAEFFVCALPFSIYLIFSQKGKLQISLLALSISFNIVALMMTGTRSALLSILALTPVAIASIYVYFRSNKNIVFDFKKAKLVTIIGISSILVFGFIPSKSEQISIENGGNSVTPIERSISRTASMAKSKEYTEGSFSVRSLMWKATGRMILNRPFSGFGAGSWEVESPVFQEDGTQLETDFYAHNEFLQLLAEYGFVGLVFLMGLFSYIFLSIYRTIKNRTIEGLTEAPIRSVAIFSLLFLMIVSNAGFPWRLAVTGAIFALSLSVLAASDIRLGYGFYFTATKTTWTIKKTNIGLASGLVSLVLFAYISYQSIKAEENLIRAAQIALTISKSEASADKRWDMAKKEMLSLVNAGIAINPHYRKVTPIVADNLAQWGDWKNAILIWESVAKSRPNVVALNSNIALGYFRLGDYEKSLVYLNKAAAVQPSAETVKSLQSMFIQLIDKDKRAMQLRD